VGGHYYTVLSWDSIQNFVLYLSMAAKEEDPMMVEEGQLMR
jgi:hypothetical protein